MTPERPGYGIAPAGFRLSPDLRLGPVRLQIADLGRAVAHYESVLGMTVLARAEGGATLGAADHTPLVELHERPGAEPVPLRGRLGLYHFAILLPDRAALGRFVGHLASAGIRHGSADHLVSEALYLRDPDGLGIEVYADRPRAGWQVQETPRGRELAMAVDPLDLQSLVEAGTGEWTGMPPGTVMGHVHLHVADLDAASAFYHPGLGLDAMVWSYPGALFLSAGGYHHHLAVNTWAGPGAPRPGPGDARLLEWTLRVPSAPDAEGAARSLMAEGYRVQSGARGWRAADPWGTELRMTSG